MSPVLRLLHLVGIFCLGLMLWSGLLIYWAHDPYDIVIFGHTLFHFFPDWFYELTDAKRKLALGMGWHFVIQWVFMANGLLYVGWLITSGHWRDVLPTKLRHFSDAVSVTLHDVGLVKKLPEQGLYNAAQRFAYTSIPLLGAMASLSGWAIYKPVQLGWLLHFFGTYEIARGVHFITALLFVGFIVVHVLQVLKAGSAHIAAMFLGTSIVEKPLATTPEDELTTQGA